MPTDVPQFNPGKTPKWTVKQSRFKHCNTFLPVRSLVCGPSGSGKGVFLTSSMLDMWRGCFQKIYVMSPTAFIDSQWSELRKYMADHLDQHDDGDDPGFFDTWDPAKLRKIIETQRKIVEHQKKQRKHKGGELYQICIILDDFASEGHVMRDPILSWMFTKIRHWHASILVSVQKYRLASTVLRTQATLLVYFTNVRSQVDLEAFLEENSALVKGGKKTMHAIFEAVKATGPFSFLAIDMMAKDRNKTFIANMSHYVQVD